MSGSVSDFMLCESQSFESFGVSVDVVKQHKEFATRA